MMNGLVGCGVIDLRVELKTQQPIRLVLTEGFLKTTKKKMKRRDESGF